MDWLDFIASVVGSLAWPLAVVIIVWLLRREIQGLLERLEKVRHKDTEATFFARKVDQIAERVSEQSELSSGRQPTPEATEGRDDRAAAPVFTPRELAMELDGHPPSIVLESWDILERLLREKASLHGLKAESLAGTLSAMAKAGLITGTQRDLIVELSTLRNAVAHSDTHVHYRSAMKYSGAVASLVRKLAQTD